MVRPTKPPEPLLHFASREAFRDWLARHHQDHPPVWLRFYKKHTGRTQCTYDEAVEEALCYGWIDSLVRRLDDDCYAQLFSPRKNTTKWSESNLARVRRLIAAGRMTDAGLRMLGVDPGRAVGEAARAQEPELEPGLQRKLRASRDAWAGFQRMAPSQQRLYVRWIMAAKKPETRLRRLDEATGKLARGEPLGMK